MRKPCGLVILCCVAILCPVASVALLVARCSLPRLSSRLCCHRRYLNLACLHASPRPQHLSHCLLALPSYPIPRGLRYCHRHQVNCLCVAHAHVFVGCSNLSPHPVWDSCNLIDIPSVTCTSAHHHKKIKATLCAVRMCVCELLDSPALLLWITRITDQGCMV